METNIYKCKLTGRTVSGNCQCQTGQYVAVSQIIKFTIPGPPQGKARARTGKGFAYTPENTVLYENLIKAMYLKEHCMRVDNLDIPLEMHIKAYCKISKSASLKKYADMHRGATRPTKKPDWDNIGKVVSDALNGIAYHDDAQIVRAIVEKWYSDEPRVEVEIREVTQ
jgi:Holliday junction resolvase RusA-like endonuclease